MGPAPKTWLPVRGPRPRLVSVPTPAGFDLSLIASEKRAWPLVHSWRAGAVGQIDSPLSTGRWTRGH